MEQISPRGLSNEVWYLIVRQFLSQEDLLAVCAVSEFFRALATPVLYRSVVLRSFRDNKKITLDPDSGDIHDESATFGLYCHLMNEENTNLRAWVRDVTLAAKQTREDPAKSLKRLDDFTGLVKILPNLENIYLKEELPLTDMFLDTIRDHENSPRLHLFHEIGRTKVDRQVPSLRTLSISISPDFIRDGDPEDSPLTLAPRELFLAFLNLQTLVISVQRRFGGCVMGPRHPLYFSPLNLLEKESFPPLESLSLSGYYVYAEEMLSWRTKLPWQTLRSLHLTENKGFLKSITGSPLLLKELVIFEAEGTTDGECGELEQFLLSFDTLERLDVTGKLPRMDAVAHHPALNHLRLHEIEEHDTTRSNLALEDVQLLDQECRCLQSLEIDITWDDGWAT
ncbi:hypothetical protein PENANT_c011G07915 [Penicillium antarcticum]|uniref:F-box domain-containing protein n=1 Tax=Penicillium antarcticum TaxID=416450 RepID=A0A1V6Q7Z8_9EURO|nr:hypothetical protein PENANT_c011G07915 [Penicillium antarcticum]